MSSGQEGLPRLAIAVLCLELTLELARLVDPYPGLGVAASIGIRVMLAMLWLLAAIAIGIRERWGRRAAIRLGRLAWVSLAALGLLETLRSAPDGSAHIVAAMIVALATESLAGTLHDGTERANLARDS